MSPHAVVIGDVRLAARSSVWPTAVLRGDINYIEIGEGSNVQDGCVVHLGRGFAGGRGKLVTVGHRAILHACTVEDECLIGMGATILDGAVVGRGSIVGAHALVTKDMKIPPGSLVMGMPAKVVRPLTLEEIEGIRVWGRSLRGSRPDSPRVRSKKNQLKPRIGLRNFPVSLAGSAAMASGVPLATTRPPPSPPCGPRSMT